jgi:hypothetical protein
LIWLKKFLDLYGLLPKSLFAFLELFDSRLPAGLQSRFQLDKTDRQKRLNGRSKWFGQQPF